MAFDPIPIIPQNPVQAEQRDMLHQRRNPTHTLPRTPVQEAARLRAAISAHQEAITAAGSLRVMAEDEEHNAPIFDAKHAADQALWNHLKDHP